jgi:rubrerythrin
MNEIDKALHIALKRELESVRLYTHLSTHNDLEPYKKVVTRILEFEKEHVRIVRDLINTHNFDALGIVHRNISHIPNVVPPKNFEEIMTDAKKMVAFAIKKEEKSFRFYQKMLELYSAHIILADIAKKLMIEEESHRLELEKIYRTLM